jgi:hypothetical protein
MNSYFSVTGDPGRSTLRPFQELVFHLEFPYQSFGFAEPGPLAEVERWFLVDVVSPVGGNPVPEGSLVNAEHRAIWAISRDFMMTAFTASSLNSGENFRRFRGSNA